jgi:ATP phosphoribosyltransferase
VIVDLVETGRTLQENGLSVIDVITESTGRFVVNRASYQLKAESIGRLLNALEQALSGVAA